MSTVHVFEKLIGRVADRALGAKGDESMVLTFSDGSSACWFHEQDCCERVRIEDVCGDIADLVGSPLLVAEEVSEEPPKGVSYMDESYTWTFYKFATAKGSVTVRWLGASNGYYSERVDFCLTEPSNV